MKCKYIYSLYSPIFCYFKFTTSGGKYCTFHSYIYSTLTLASSYTADCLRHWTETGISFDILKTLLSIRLIDSDNFRAAINDCFRSQWLCQFVFTIDKMSENGEEFQFSFKAQDDILLFCPHPKIISLLSKEKKTSETIYWIIKLSLNRLIAAALVKISGPIIGFYLMILIIIQHGWCACPTCFVLYILYLSPSSPVPNLTEQRCTQK